MRVQILRRDLLQAIKVLKPFSKSTNVHLKNRIAFDLSSGDPFLADSVLIKATDGVSYATKFIVTHVEGKGRICLDIVKLASVLRFLRGSYIVIEYPYDGKELVNVKSTLDGVSFSFKAEQEHSELYDLVIEFNCPIKVPDHHRMVFGEMLPLTSGDSYRQILQNICFDGETIRATNGFMAGYRNFNMGDFKGLVPANIITAVNRGFPYGFSVYFGQKDNRIAFRTQDTFVCTRIGEGNFPDIDAVMKKEPKLVVEAQLADLRNILRPAKALMTKNSLNGVLLSIEKDGSAKFNVESYDYSYDAHHKFNVDYAADMDYPFNIGINPVLFVSMINGFYPSERVKLSFSTYNEPIKFEMIQRSFTGVLMPMHLDRIQAFKRV